MKHVVLFVHLTMRHVENVSDMYTFIYGGLCLFLYMYWGLFLIQSNYISGKIFRGAYAFF